MKQKFLDMLAAYVAASQDIRAKFNAVLTGMAPLEQQELAGAGLSAIRELEWGQKRLADMAATYSEVFDNADKLLTALVSDSTDEALEARIAAGELVRKSDHDTAIAAARESAATTGRQEAEVEFQAARQKIETISTRRAAVTEKFGAEIAASSFDDESLAGEGYEARVTVLDARREKLTGLHVTPEDRKEIFLPLMASADPVEDQNPIFERSLALALSAAGGSFAPKKPAGPGLSKKPSVPASPGSTAARKVIF